MMTIGIVLVSASIGFLIGLCFRLGKEEQGRQANESLQDTIYELMKVVQEREAEINVRETEIQRLIAGAS